MRFPEPSRWWSTVAWGTWALFCAWCVRGFPPAIDLPVHAAHMQVLADLLLHRGTAHEVYRAAFPLGYGFSSWLFAPLAMVTNGAVAGRAAVWLTLVLLPVAHGRLARSLQRSTWAAWVGAPFAFCLSYRYGFLPTFFATPWVLLTWALFVEGAVQSTVPPTRRALLMALSVLVMLSHVVAFGVLAVGLVALTLGQKPLRSRLVLLGTTLTPALVLSAGFLATLFDRATVKQPGSAPHFDLPGHVNWVYLHGGTEERVSQLACLAVVGACGYLWVRRWKTTSRAPVLLAGALAVLYLVTPMSISRAWLIYPRTAIFVAYAALLLVELRELNRGWWVFLGAASLLSLLSVARLHHTFHAAVEGLSEIIAQPTPAGPHGGIVLDDTIINDGRMQYLDHITQWWTAAQGNQGNDLFADADHQPVRFLEGRDLPAALYADTPGEALNRFEALLILGDKALPGAISGWAQVAQTGRWRVMQRRTGY